MRLKRRWPALGFLLLGALPAASCLKARPTTAPVRQPGVSPVGEKQGLEDEEWAEATRGLDFGGTGGLVEVEHIPGGNASAAAEHLKQGDELIEANRVTQALEQYGLAVRNDPDLAAAYVGIGVTLKREGKLDQAISAFRTAVDRDADGLENRYQLAMALWTAGRQDEAISQLTEVVAADDEFGKAHERLALWDYYVGDYAAAWRHLHRAQTLGQSVPQQFVALLRERMPDPDTER